MDGGAVAEGKGRGLPLWATAILSAGMAAAFVALRIMQLGELWLDRTYWLVTIAAFGAAVGVIGTMIALQLPPMRKATRKPGWLILLGVTFMAAFMAGMMAGFCLEFLLISGQFEPNPERPIRGTIVAVTQTGALFLISSPTYLLPWPLPLLALFTAALIAPKLPHSTS